MRFLFFVTTCLAMLLVFWAASVEAKDKGGRGKSGGGHGHSQKSGGQKSVHGGGKAGGKTNGGENRTLADNSPKPQKEKEQAKEHDKDKVKREKDAEKEKERAKEKFRDDDSDNHDGDQGEDSDSDQDMDDDEDESPPPVNKKEKQLELAKRHRDKKIAQAEHLRRIAERNGNPNLLANADRMEAQAQAEYAKRAAHLEKFGVTDPTLPPLDASGDPLVPATKPSFPVGAN